jgi:hypothetical protein
MAVHIWRNRRTVAETAPPAHERTKVWPRRTAAVPVEDDRPVRTAPPVVVRRPARRWRVTPNPISQMILGAAWAAVIILGLGMLLTLTEANPGNALVGATLDAGRWLATPFHDVFTDPDPEKALYLNWGLAAGVYYLLGRLLSWLTRF